MTLRITLRPEAEDRLEKKAAKLGVPPQALAKDILEERLLLPEDNLREPTVEEDPELAYQYALLKAGLISKIKPRIANLRSYHEVEPIRVTGKPISETIIEERI